MKVQRVETPYDPENPDGPTFSDWLKLEDLERLVLGRNGLGARETPDVFLWDAVQTGEAVDDSLDPEVVAELEALGGDAD